VDEDKDGCIGFFRMQEVEALATSVSIWNVRLHVGLLMIGLTALDPFVYGCLQIYVGPVYRQILALKSLSIIV
jgi:hypothetical protein